MLRTKLILATYLVYIKQSTEESIVLFPKLIHLFVARMDVTLRPCNLFLVIKVARPIINEVLGRGKMLSQVGMVLIGQQACAISRFDVTTQHLHLLGCHLDWARSLAENRGAQS